MIGFIYQGIARTQSPTNKNDAFELPTFGVIVGVSRTEVQWSGLALEEPPSWSRLTSTPGKYAVLAAGTGPSQLGIKKGIKMIFRICPDEFFMKHWQYYSFLIWKVFSTFINCQRFKRNETCFDGLRLTSSDRFLNTPWLTPGGASDWRPAQC